ncbi:MAG: undecaprenyl/decaprenyl-phosphate alpha-N-acetylglucosaminyl 1-phosphate transferase [Calditrichaeota bacterium]|nr:MAG: undecaprenyl/decaprenyl-phosphate alpha-N-acetylglucosaminyl 1-phosphate transferase [Calditrichota bacterium]
MKYFLYLIIPLATAWLLTPVFRRFAKNHHIVARQNHRTVHQGEVAKLVGGAIFSAFILGLIVTIYFDKAVWADQLPAFLGLAIGALILFIVGAIDDRTDLNCNLKLFIEIIAASLPVFWGWRIESLVFPASVNLQLGFLSYPLSILWIVGITNSFNMIDGLDGLAGGIAVVVLISSLSIAMLFGNTLLPMFILILLGATLGFLRYNINPASIFMGDSGSLSLGFLLACITISASTHVNGTSVLVLFLLLGLPLTDTTLAIIRRLRRGIHPFHADREHIHHRLVNLGLSHSGAATTMVGFSLVLGLMAYLVAHGIYMDLQLLK